MENNATLNKGPSPELHIAARYGNDEAIIPLVKEYKVDINQKDKDGETALMKAASYGKVGVIIELLRFKSIDIYCKNKKGETARDLAIKKNHPEVIKVLDDCLITKQNLFILGLFGSGQSSLKTLSSNPLFDLNTIEIVSDFLRPNLF